MAVVRPGSQLLPGRARGLRPGRRVLAASTALLLCGGLLAACSSARLPAAARHPGQKKNSAFSASDPLNSGIHKIKHVIVIMQENRSFDEYFGTYPGADGIRRKDGSTPCVPDQQEHGCVRPYHDSADVNGGGPHGRKDSNADVDGGKMDGFIKQRNQARNSCHIASDPACEPGGKPDVMGYHTAAEIPNYWKYAKNYVLQDHMFEAVKSWSLPAHLYMVSAWSAKCKDKDPLSCATDIGGPYNLHRFDDAVQNELNHGKTNIDLAWTDLTWLLHQYHVSWRYYIQTGLQPDCSNDSAETCAPVRQKATTPGIWNPLALFGDVKEDHQLRDIQNLDGYFSAARRGKLPAVSWVVPSEPDSDHPPASVHQAQAYVTSVVNAAMKSPDWSSTAIFMAWDDWGGFYDHVNPPTVDHAGYGMRVPAMIISPYAKRGYIDHQVLSSDAYLKFIEDDFLQQARLDPRTDGRPDRRPDVREDANILGNLANDFDFSQKARPPLLLPTNPRTDSPTIPAQFQHKGRCYGCTRPPATKPNTGAFAG
ncbi:MAG TPA: alkaline phosphatase family protein [Streptosporangiaceae bacterium]